MRRFFAIVGLASALFAVTLPGFAEPYSTLAVGSAPTIDDNGNVWDGSSKLKKKATLTFDNDGRAWWVSDARNSYGPAERKRAPKLDQPVSIQHMIDPSSGEATVQKLMGPNVVAKKQLGWADLKYLPDGRAYFEFNGQRILANRPPQPQYGSQPGPQGQPAGQNSGQPGSQIVNKPLVKSTFDRRIDPAKGTIIEKTFVDGKVVSERPVGQAKARLFSNHRRYWIAPGMRPVMAQ